MDAVIKVKVTPVKWLHIYDSSDDEMYQLQHFAHRLIQWLQQQFQNKRWFWKTVYGLLGPQGESHKMVSDGVIWKCLN